MCQWIFRIWLRSERIKREGGSQSWILNPSRARQCVYLVCTQNQHHPDRGFSDATEPHGTGFLVGRISKLTRVIDPPTVEGEPGQERWLIEISEFAAINIPDLWGGWRNPIHYTSLEELGIAPESLHFEKLRDEERDEPGAPESVSESLTRALTIADAKMGLALTYGVSPEAIEIVIRG